MTKTDLTNIITNNIMQQLQKPKDALTNIATVYGQWLRRTVKEAQMEAQQNAQMNMDNTQQPSNGGTNVQPA